ncbi:hypothetical protein DXA78_22320 [Bacteroides fragilis]|uniref:Uncharacterized protein n=2 Tax=Bacteroides fragilis TaxID=817 RepID=D1JSD1_BACFG|nr:hypothetical protein HMPREF0101_02882 [Bacteroides fragilis]BAD50154.1 hypothetical protein BF3410 [Bacteroides fragilis YCH46]KAA4739749.1 hypothetical protein F3B36_17865 [Bacteroides fragilis]KAA4758300.1 hypothetical protein F3B47_16065 [Bacteroides fragilis]KAA4758814.1 hypothetical protein F3B24_19410 [Bacteroides fragilis]
MFYKDNISPTDTLKHHTFPGNWSNHFSGYKIIRLLVYTSYLNGQLFIFLSSIDQRTAYIKQKHQTDNGHQCSYHGETTFLL